MLTFFLVLFGVAYLAFGVYFLVKAMDGDWDISEWHLWVALVVAWPYFWRKVKHIKWF